MSSQLKSRVVNVSLTALVALLLVFGNTLWRLHTQFRLGEAAVAKGDFAASVARFESALHMYIPFHPLVNRAASELWKIGETNERAGDVNRALIAYRSLRSSFYSAGWLITPGLDWIEKCDRKIAALRPYQQER